MFSLAGAVRNSELAERWRQRGVRGACRVSGLGRRGADPLLLVLGRAGRHAATAMSGGRRKRRSRSTARTKIAFAGQALAKASLMRRTLIVTTAPILRSFS